MYCHVLEDKVIINDVQGVEPRHLKERMDKVSKGNIWGYILNITLTLALFGVVLYTSFYPLLLLVFVSTWHISKLKKQTLPVNQSDCIPLEYIEKAVLSQGTLGFNYLKFFIDYKGVKSMRVLRLYDSESTYQSAFKILSAKLPTEIEQEEKKKISGIAFPIGKKDAYILSDDTLYFVNNNEYDSTRLDSYRFIRWIGAMHFIIILYAVGMKFYLIQTTPSNFIDYLVLLLFIIFLALPFYYINKALPNKIEVEKILKVTENKKKIILKYITSNWKLPVTTKFDKKHLDKETQEVLRNLKSN